MSKIETVSVRVTKTVVRYSVDEYDSLIVRQACQDAGITAGPNVATHVRTEGDEVVCELIVEQGSEPEPEEDIGPRPVMAR